MGKSIFIRKGGGQLGVGKSTEEAPLLVQISPHVYGQSRLILPKLAPRLSMIWVNNRPQMAGSVTACLLSLFIKLFHFQLSFAFQFFRAAEKRKSVNS